MNWTIHNWTIAKSYLFINKIHYQKSAVSVGNDKQDLGHATLKKLINLHLIDNNQEDAALRASLICRYLLAQHENVVY